MLLLLLGLLAGAEAAKPPNILFAIADDWGPHAGAYGTRWVKTPNFDRVAREGLLFKHAYTPIAKCAPSRSAILTGREPWLLKAAANHICQFPPEFKSWCEALREHGWTVGKTTKGWGPGDAKDAAGKPRQMAGVPQERRKAQPPASGISRSDYAGNFIDFLAAAPKDKPWCFWAGGLEPHREYEFGSGVRLGGKKLSDVDRVPGYWPDCDTVRNDLLDYAFEVEHWDRHLGRMLEELERRGALDHTLIVLTADHGMPFPRCKGNAYPFANQVPFAVRWPGGIKQPGRVVEDFVSLTDLAPTFLEAAGLPVAKSGLATPTGRSLLPLLAGGADPLRDHVLIGKERTDIGRPNDGGYPTRGIVTAQWLYLRNHAPDRWPGGNPETGYLDCDAGATKTLILAEHRRNPADLHWALCFGKRPGEELYDLVADPDCLRNLAEDAAHAAAKRSLREAMEAKLKADGDPRQHGGGDEFDKYPQANPRFVGFYEKFLRGEKVPTGWVSPTDADPLPAPPKP